jgi:aldehyde:ferredoxin oxidoreductase
MGVKDLGGYTGRILRVDLGRRHFSEESFQEETLRDYIGGVGIGIKVLYGEVPPGVSWSDGKNTLILMTGPLNGTSIAGSGTICAVTKGCLTNGGASSQANGYFGAYLKTSGVDGTIIQGASEDWIYLYIHDGIVEFKDAKHLLSKDTIKTETLVKSELGKKGSNLSVYSIGPAGENLVKFAMIHGDQGHVIAHNGFGAVMGSKKIKAVAVAKGDLKLVVKDQKKLLELSNRMNQQAKEHPVYGRIHKYGTSMLWPMLAKSGLVPVKNLTTNIFPESEKFSREYYGSQYKMKRKPCWACPLHHCQQIKVEKGPHAGLEADDPEYECAAAWSSLIGNNDFESALVLSDLADRLGLNSTEAGWTIALAIESYEEGVITEKDTDGLKMTWGNVEAVGAMLMKIAHREGFGDVLAEGVMRAAERIGGEAPNLAVYVKKGHGPRTHDARARWSDILDYAVGGVGTSESNSVPLDEPFSPQNVALAVKKGKVREFVDSLVVCNIATMTYSGTDVKNLVEALNLITGWDYTEEEAIQMSLRVSNLFRVFNIQHGLTPDLEIPSAKYGSAPVDGPMEGKSIMPKWKEIMDEYYRIMGWDRSTGKPLPETLQKLGLGWVVADIW